jgi:hypothetical protein
MAGATRELSTQSGSGLGALKRDFLELPKPFLFVVTERIDLVKIFYSSHINQDRVGCKLAGVKPESI